MREPVVRKVRKRLGERTTRVRNAPGKTLERRLPSLENRNVGKGTLVGALGAAIATVLDDTVGIPFGATVDIVDIQESGDELLYVVDVNAPTENIAEARAFMDSTTGFLSYLTDKYDIESVEVQTKRVFRDTHRVEVLVEK